jgi:hypothetical protein
VLDSRVVGSRACRRRNLFVPGRYSAR